MTVDRLSKSCAAVKMDTHEELLKEVEIRLKLKELANLEEELLAMKIHRKLNLPTLNEDHINKIPKWAIERYSRQLVIPELGCPTVVCSKLIKSSVLVVGLGGLGCPASSYLAGAGIGRIGLLDFDTVESSNLARQILHSEGTQGLSKVLSAELGLRKINSCVKYVQHENMLTSENALEIMKEYDVILDCTDNLPTRYLINDACVLLKKPLVSASALRTDGMITVYNCESHEFPKRGPCFRCIFPTPPEDVGSCGTAGILGPVVGVMGCLQALETIKVILGKSTLPGRLLIFDGMDATMKNVKLRNKNPECLVCSENPKIQKLIDYPTFCNATVSDKCFRLNILKPEERIFASELLEKTFQRKLVTTYSDNTKQDDNIVNLNFPIFPDTVFNKAPVLFVDVRPSIEFNMFKLPYSLNCPYDKFKENVADLLDVVDKNAINEVYFICRRGNDSQLAVQDFQAALKKSSPKGSSVTVVKDIKGGLIYGWKTAIKEVPIY